MIGYAPRPPPRPARSGCGPALGALFVVLLLIGLVGAAVAVGVVLYLKPELLDRGSSAALEVERDLEPNPKAPVSVDAAGKATVVLPPGTVATKTKLQVFSVSGVEAPPEASVGTTVDVRLGDLHAFAEPITIAIPYDPSKVQGRRGKRPLLLALTYDPSKRSWEPVPFSVDEARRVILVQTSHLSMFSTVFPEPIKVSPTARIERAAFPFAVDFADASTAENILKGSTAVAAEAGWKASMEWFGIGQAVATLGEEGAIFADYGLASTVLGKVNEVAGNLGVAFALVQLGLDMSKDGNKTVAVGTALKAIGFDAISRWGTSAMKIAGVGVFMLDYSLGKFADAAWSGRNDLWARALNCYYKEHGRTHAEWLARFKAIVSSSSDPTAASAGIRAEVEEFANKVWESEEELGICQAQLGAANLGGGGGLNAKLQKDLSNDYARQLFSDLRPELDALAAWATLQQQQRTHALLGELLAKLNQKTVIEVVLKSKDPKRKLGDYSVAITTRKDPKLWQGKTNAAGTFTMEVTSLGYMLYGTPTDVVVTLPAGPDGKPNLRKAKLAYRPGKTRVEVDIGEDARATLSLRGPLLGEPKKPYTFTGDVDGLPSAVTRLYYTSDQGDGGPKLTGTVPVRAGKASFSFTHAWDAAGAYAMNLQVEDASKRGAALATATARVSIGAPDAGAPPDAGGPVPKPTADGGASPPPPAPTPPPALPVATHSSTAGKSGDYLWLEVTMGNVGKFSTKDGDGWRHKGAEFSATATGNDKVAITITVGAKPWSYSDYIVNVLIKNTGSGAVYLTKSKDTIPLAGGTKTYSFTWDPKANPGNLSIEANVVGGNPESSYRYIKGGIGTMPK